MTKGHLNETATPDDFDDLIGGAQERASKHAAKPSNTDVMLNVRVPPELRQRVKILAAETGVPVRTLVMEALEQRLAQPPEQPDMDDDDGI